nr:MAG TPA: hypothetical protein [Caudoviricetes sp.]
MVEENTKAPSTILVLPTLKELKLSLVNLALNWLSTIMLITCWAAMAQNLLTFPTMPSSSIISKPRVFSKVKPIMVAAKL